MDKDILIIVKGKVPAKSSLKRMGISKRGKPFMYSRKKTYQYEVAFMYSVLKLKRDNQFPLTGRLYIGIDWYTDSYRQDVDSPPKIIMDCLQKAGIVANDNVFDKLTITRYIDKQNPRAEITIKEYNG